jgi:hypothetical protein
LAEARDDEYQDSLLAGSLAGALRAWLRLLASNTEAIPLRVVFTLSCPGESRALRVAGYLRRRLSCPKTTIGRIDGGTRDEWQVEGTTVAEVQSLADLERVFTWLSRTANRHQVRLIGLTFAQ